LIIYKRVFHIVNALNQFFRTFFSKSVYAPNNAIKFRVSSSLRQVKNARYNLSHLLFIIYQQKLADILGVNQTTVSQWLLGNKKPGYDSIMLLYKKFDIEPNLLFDLSI